MIKLKISLLLVLLALVPINILLATDETITLTTYYPSPFGSYDKLQTNRLAVGDTNNDGQMSIADLPSRNGDIRLQPQPGNPANWPAGAEGQIAYSSANDELYHSNGSSWVAQGGGGVCYTNYGHNTCANGYTAVLTGYTTVYVGYDIVTNPVAGMLASGGLACSSLSHDSTSYTNIGLFGVTSVGKYDNIANESCAICCN